MTGNYGLLKPPNPDRGEARDRRSIIGRAKPRTRMENDQLSPPACPSYEVPTPTSVCLKILILSGCFSLRRLGVPGNPEDAVVGERDFVDAGRMVISCRGLS